LGLFIDQAVPAGLPLEETVLRVGDLEGCVCSSPDGPRDQQLEFCCHLEHLKNPKVAKILIGIEAFNGAWSIHGATQS